MSNESAATALSHLEQLKLKHAGHEALHSFLVLFLFVSLISTQIALVWWKKNHPKSYMRVTLALLWVLPLGVSLYLRFFRMLVFLLAFSGVASYFVSRPFLEKPMARHTPKRVYRFFHYCISGAFYLAVGGYALFMLDVFGAGRAFSYYGGLLMFYGLYFGVLARDLAEFATDAIAKQFGFKVGRNSIPSRVAGPQVCAVCNEALESRTAGHKLDCGHTFHSDCIRGWTMVGKKDSCPQCQEKVALSDVFTHPWEKTSVLWSQLLDMTRYMVVWNPLILIVVQSIIWAIDH